MRWTRVLAAASIGGGVLLLALLGNARVDPVLKTATVALPGWPRGAPPIRVLVWSDLHLGNLATDGARLARLVALANALDPDLVLLAGDFVAGHAREDGAAAADLDRLAMLRPRYGSVAVLGNHDAWTEPAAIRAVLQKAGVIVLENAAVRRGPLTIGGLGDAPTRQARVGETRAAMARLGGAKLLLAHSPDVPGGWRGLVIAGHTHCGQLVLPLVGAPVAVATNRYRCGIVREPGRTTIVTAGTGTSVLPLRLGAPPDWWLLTLVPAGCRPQPRASSISRAVALAEPTTPGMPAPGWVPAPTK